MTRHRVILDCDPGVDDAISLLVAMASPDELDILAITTVAGNVPLDVITRNALSLTELAGRPEIAVHAGAAGPLVKPPVFADHVHGEHGLGPAALGKARHPAREAHAVDFLVETLRAAPDASITLVPTGPLTNIAAALTRAPDIARAIREIVLMGGAYREGGNITPSAEFNMSVDPHAASIVFACARPITVFGLDATYQLRMNPERMARLKAVDSEVGGLAHSMLCHVNDAYAGLYGAEGCALHDPCTVGFLLAPELFETRSCHIEVETESVLTSGHTAVDFYKRTDRPDNARWVTRLDADALFDLLCERLARL